MITICGCCEGIRPLTPVDTSNRPGLDAIFCRVGTHSTFLETMKARLSRLDLRTREAKDFSIALLDAWAMVADVLTFYQERIANEGYIRTATERRSVLELARLIGYALRPGVASSVYLAYTLEKDHAVDIAAGSRAQSIPGPGELPQSFETSAILKSRDRWNNLAPRTTQPQKLSQDAPVVYIKGITTNLKPNDRLLFDFGFAQVPRRVMAVDPDSDRNRTKITLESAALATASTATVASTSIGGSTRNISTLWNTIDNLIKPLTKAPASHPRDSLLLPRDVDATFAPTSDVLPRLLTTLKPELGPQLYTALSNAEVSPPAFADVYVFRARASAFGHNAPKKVVFEDNQIKDPVEWPLTRSLQHGAEKFSLGVVAIRTTGVEDFAAANVAEWTLTTTAALDAASVKDENRPLTPGTSFTIPFPAANDVITVTFTASATIPFRLVYTFQKRSLAVTIDSRKLTSNLRVVSVTTSGTNPTDTVVFRAESADNVLVEIQATALSGATAQRTEAVNKISLDNVYDKVVPRGWILLEGAMTTSPIVSRVEGIAERSRADYGISGKLTEITLETGKPWLDFSTNPDLSKVRDVAVFAQSERLELAEEPISKPLCGARIELDGVYDGLESGRWLIVAGERHFGEEAAVNTSGVLAAELVMLAGADQDVRKDLPSDKLHTFLSLASGGLAYCYKLDTVTIYGNVAHATHGETRGEVLGNGDATQEFPVFPLKQFPLTYISAITPSGVASTLQVRVNDLLWHEAPNLAALGPNDRAYLTRTGDDSKTSVVFGNGVRGARVPTGIENLKTVYRTGIGQPGNVKAGQISLLSTKPLGVKEVINPIRASGGADRESRDSARANAPLAVMSLDRLVSIQDYADFARTFAGVGKATAAQLAFGHTSIVHVTIAGEANIAIDESSDLFRNLFAAFAKFGDPQQPVQLAVREPMLLVIHAKVAILPDYQFESVAPKIRIALFSKFGFDQRNLAQDVLQSEIVSTIQNIEGVQYVDLDTLDTVPEDLSRFPLEGMLPPRIPVKPARLDAGRTRILPAQLAFLSPDIPEALILTELTSA